MQNICRLSRYAAMITRFGQMYFDRCLQPFAIGCGQQFFLLYISENPGISQWELAKALSMDKSTTAKAVKKLEALGYARREQNKSDKRIQHLYTTEKAEPALAAAIQGIQQWNAIITEKLSLEEHDQGERLLQKMAETARSYFTASPYGEEEKSARSKPSSFLKERSKELLWKASLSSEKS